MKFKIIIMIFFLPSFIFAGLLKDVNLKFRPTSSLADYDYLDLSGLSSVSISLGNFIDEREDKNLIGENREDENEGKILQVTTITPIPEFLKEVFSRLFKDVGVKISDGNPKVLELQVIKFYAEEKNLYKAEVWLDLKLKKGNVVLWEDRVMGSVKRFGRSYKLENYLEALSDAIIDCFASLFQNGKFTKALKE